MLRKRASRITREGSDSEREMANVVIDRIDEFVGNPQAAQVLTGDAKAGAETLKQARSAWRRAKKTETIEELINKAEIDVEGGAAKTVVDALRSNVRILLKNPKRMRGFTEQETTALREFAKGSRTKRVLGLIGKLSPSSLVGIGVGGTAVTSGLAVGSPLGLLVPAIGGGGAKFVAGRTGAMRQRIAQQLIATGKPTTVTRPGPLQQKLVDALIRTTPTKFRPEL